MSKTKGVQKDATESDMLVASYFAGEETSTDLDWTQQTANLKAADKLRNPFCLYRAPYGNEQYGKENLAPFHLSSHQYVKAYEADPVSEGVFTEVRNYLKQMFQ